MGCGGSNRIQLTGDQNISQIPINTMIFLLGEEHESEVLKVKYLVFLTEELRHAVIDEIDYISIFTGNCSHRILALNIYSCIVALSWKIAADCKGHFEDSEIKHKPHKEKKISLKGKYCSKEAVEANNYLFKYLGTVEKLKEKLQEIMTLRPEFEKIISSWTANRKKFDPEKIKNNIDNANHTIKVSDDLAKQIEVILEDGKRGIEYLINKSNYDDINAKGLKMFKDEVKIPHIIAWKLIDPKLRTLNKSDGYYYMSERIVKKKKIISEYKNNLLLK